MIGAAVVGVFEALHPDFITIVDAGNARIGHLPKRGHHDTSHAEIVLCLIEPRTRLFYSRHTIIIGCLAQKGNGPLHIMAADQIHHRIKILGRIIFTQAFKLPEAAAAIRISQQIIKQDLAERVVHCRVHFLTAKIFPLHTIGYFMGSIFPNLANHNRIGIRLLELRIEPLGKWFGQLIDHIQPPAGNSLFEPVMQDAPGLTDYKIHIGRRGFGNIRQRIKVPPALILMRKVAKVVPLIIRRFRGLECTYTIVLALAVEIAAVAARMAEYAIQYHAYSLRSCFFYQFLKIFFIPEDRINLQIIAGIVVVIAFRFKDRIQVDHRDSQFLQVSQFFDDALDIATEEIIGNDFPGIGVLIITGIVTPVGMKNRALLADNLIPFALEPVRKDLVHDGVLKPVGCFGTLMVNRNLK